MLKHVSFLTRDLGAVLAFYTQLGGIVEKDLTTHEGHRRGVVRLGEGRLQFFQVQGEAPAPHPHWAEHVALHVRGLRDLLPLLKAAGVTVTRDLQPSPGGRDMAFVLDPDGRQVELLEGDESI
ncbi:VOC family protein [Deinococcus wulumuqiensis]|uniref:Lactoylglutathione lyase n=1 Tax=Deinococcus wulumuqiensis TaxID=980427 RepID=A0AAV4K4D2_9DEIO|nr:VOC family protein [Deinococcus wulumuqiensis]QII20511.1 VOC family protein [Deinococcus wulumuqiensis R12]GGI78219.1 lactoylglutathione lyase [Deinococcus wulumuqiensis]GGP28928.1 lactoylglutathione lyase [Deinococcus wulumuqiensis]